MNTFKKLFSRHFYKTISFWLLFLITLYTVIGFLILPNIINNTITEQVESQLGWQTRIDKIKVNPYMFTLNINQLAITEDQTSIISFKSFHADFELRSIIEGAFTFKNVALIEPTFNISIDKKGITNIQKAFSTHQSLSTEQTDESPSAMPKLLFDSISIKDGTLSATDNSQKETIKHKLNPISFNLKSFSTFVEAGGDYNLQISLGTGQSIKWSGSLSVAPINSQGSFSINGIKAHRLWPYIAPYSPYTLLNSDVNFESDYSLSYINNEFQLLLDNALVNFSDIQIALQNAPSKFLSINNIRIGPTKFNLNEKKVIVNELAVDMIDFDILKNPEGELEFLTAIDTFLSQNTGEPNRTSPSQPFLWSIKKINLVNSQVTFSDKSIKNDSIIKVHNINAELFELNQSLSNSQPFSLSYQIEDSNLNSIAGNIIATPFKLDSDIKIDNVEIPLIQPYINELANIVIDTGKISLNGNANLTMHEQNGLQGNFKGKITVNDFDSQDTVINRRLVGWEKLQITPLTVNLSPLAIDIDKIILTKPYSRLIITEDRNINFAQLMIEDTKNTENTKRVENNDGKLESKININEILIKSGSAYFADLSLRPQFGTSIQNMDGSIKDLSSSNLESADVDIKGTVEEYGKVLVKGKIKPLGGDLSTDININFDKIELTTLTPYSGRYAGYVIDKGKLSLALNYKIKKGHLDGKNRLILDQFELGDAVESDESVDLPLKLALALFKDGDGIIDISLPTKGDMNSPDFEISGLIMKAFVNVITKAVTSPFSMLANLAGGNEESLNSVQFELASTSLKQEQIDNLNTLSKVLKERPQLILEIRVNVDSEKEGLVLKKQAINHQLGLIDKSNSEQIQLLEKTISEYENRTITEEIKTELMNKQNKDEEVNTLLFEEQYRALLFNHLVGQYSLGSIELTELAQQRISVIKNQLININKVNNDQVFALNPSLKGISEESLITTTFNLSSK